MRTPGALNRRCKPPRTLCAHNAGVSLAVKATTSNADIVSPGATGRVVLYNLRGGAPVAHAISSVRRRSRPVLPGLTRTP